MPPRYYCQKMFVIVLSAIGLASTSGCLVTRVKWVEPEYVATRVGLFGSKQGLDHVERLYATALEQEEECIESCVDLFFEVAVATSRHQGSGCRKRLLHDSAMYKLVVSGQRFGRLDPRSRLLIRRDGYEESIPIIHRGFVWKPSDFHSLVPVGNYKTNGLRNLYRRRGIGVPMVVASCRSNDDAFAARRPTFAATLRMNTESDGLNESGQVGDLPITCQLELYDPLRIDEAIFQGSPRRLAADLSAPLAYRQRNDPQSILTDFINPGSATGETELRTIEPYQAGKIPVVFIHGLLSNPYTWIEMINELQSHPGFVEHFQIWVVEYPTGQPFLTSAAECRSQLREARHTFDPTHQDAQLSNMVLVGHSMGGLVAKLQITSSGDRLWHSIASRPFDEVVIRGESRQRLADAFFFEPSPDVSRVVFVGTPHRGSSSTNRCIGRVGSLLVKQPEELVQSHAELMQDNPGVFSDEVRRRIPTSIDLLEPQSKLLGAIASLPAKCEVRLHSVIGNSCYTLFNGKSDGVVTVRSAQDDRAITERKIKTVHTRLTKNAETVQELICILQQHLQEPNSTRLKPAMQQARVDTPDQNLSSLQTLRPAG